MKKSFKNSTQKAIIKEAFLLLLKINRLNCLFLNFRLILLFNHLLKINYFHTSIFFIPNFPLPAMKKFAPFPMKSKLLVGISLVLVSVGIYYCGNQIGSGDQEVVENKSTSLALSKETSVVGFVSQSNESSSSDTDLVADYSQLYGKYQVKAYANHKFTMPTEQEIEALRLEAMALDQLYSQMTLEERRKVKRISFPYAKLEVAGKVTYKRFEDLTQKERESLRC